MAKYLAGLLLGFVGLLSAFFYGKKQEENKKQAEEFHEFVKNEEIKKEVHQNVENTDINDLIKRNNSRPDKA